MSNEAKLGTIPNGNEGRDAVHVAIMPAIATESLSSGTPVKINRYNEASACRLVEDAIGVVDPFGNGCAKGSWFWLCLYPKTITGLRHVWEHPSLPLAATPESVPVDGDKSASKKWLNDYVRRHCSYWEAEPDGGYSEFLRCVSEEKRIFYYGSTCHSLDDVEHAYALFHHLSVVLGKRIDASYFEAFTCSC